MAAQPAESILTTTALLAGCQELVDNSSNGDLMRMGACAGAVRATMEVAQAAKHFCPSGWIGVVDAARHVIMFADASPARRNEPFGPLVLTALRDRWPC